MSNQIQIRGMKLEDITEVYDLGSKVPEFEVVKGETGFWKEDVLTDWVASENDVAVVAYNEKELAGFLLASYHPLTRKATIENAYMKEPYRGLYEGRHLVIEMYKETESRLKEKGADFICGFIEEENKISKRFLEKCEFDTGKLHYWMNKFLKK
jgi:hypothetical protein